MTNISKPKVIGSLGLVECDSFFLIPLYRASSQSSLTDALLNIECFPDSRYLYRIPQMYILIVEHFKGKLLVELTNTVSCLLKSSIAPRTRTQYECDNSAYVTFLRMTGVLWINSYMPPLTEESLIHFATHCFKNLHLKCSTIKMYICGIRYKYLDVKYICLKR
jgi:hypothetical protein